MIKSHINLKLFLRLNYMNSFDLLSLVIKSSITFFSYLQLLWWPYQGFLFKLTVHLMHFRLSYVRDCIWTRDLFRVNKFACGKILVTLVQKSVIPHFHLNFTNRPRSRTNNSAIYHWFSIWIRAALIFLLCANLHVAFVFNPFIWLVVHFLFVKSMRMKCYFFNYFYKRFYELTQNKDNNNTAREKLRRFVNVTRKGYVTLA